MRPVLITAMLLSAVFFLGAGTIAAQSQDLFSPDGGVFLISGHTPKAFANFGGIALTTHDYKENGRVVPIKPWGELTSGARYKMVRIVYNATEFSFETVTVRGVSYRFNGRIVDNVKYDVSGHAFGTVLRGHLKKITNGRVAAQADLEFEFEEGG